ncbi:hypothetical protein FHG87_013094 [Trinorchestia longiramus]|nr:hypothetical protein FHG87_013094 [Trinorchestia longiramus]
MNSLTTAALNNSTTSTTYHRSTALPALAQLPLNWNSSVEDFADTAGDYFDDDGRLILLSTNGTANFWSLPGDLSTKYLLNAGTSLVLFSGLFALGGIALFTLYHAAYFGDFAVRKKREIADHGSGLFGPPDGRSEGSFESSPTNFTALYALDVNWCALRLACELSARAASALTDDEKHLMMYFRSVITEPGLRAMSVPTLYYGFASYLGFRAKTANECATLYPKCPFSSQEMLRIYSSEKRAPGAESPRSLRPRKGKILTRFRDRNLDVDDGKSTIMKTLTKYEIQRRNARKERVEYILKRRQNVLRRRRGMKAQNFTSDEDSEDYNADLPEESAPNNASNNEEIRESES